MYKHFVKRFIDFVIALLLLLMISPIMVFVYILLQVQNKGKGAFYYQKRAGLYGKIFKIIKYKSMTDEKDADGNLLPDKMRLTKLGKLVRATSIDELPQFINILKGDMSLIGPRPLLPEYVPLYDNNQKRRLNVRPGITGWAQIHGRNSLKLSKRFEYDVYYVEHQSFYLDLKIFWKTFMSLLPSKVVVDREDLVGVDDLGFDKKAFGQK